MKYEPIKVKKTYEKIAESIIDMIKSGHLKPGDQLDSIEQLSNSFGVSRSAVREALSGLRAMGIVTVRQGEGTYIKEFNSFKFSLPVSTAFLMKHKDVKELYELRKILEVGAAGLASIHRDEEDLRLMREALEAMKLAKGRGENGEKADISFHLAITKATKNKMLINLMNDVSDIMVETITETRRLLLHTEDRASLLIAEHELIFDAIKKQQSDVARKHMFDHLAAVEELLFKYID